MFAYDESNRVQEHAINIGQNNDGRFPYGYRKIMPTKDFSSHSLFVKVNGNCCWKLFTRWVVYSLGAPIIYYTEGKSQSRH